MMCASKSQEHVSCPLATPRILNARLPATWRFLAIVYVVGQAALTACTPITPHRTVIDIPAIFPSADSSAGSRRHGYPTGDGQPTAGGVPADSLLKNSIEEHPNYLLGFVEFDDQGWFYDRNQMLRFLKKLKEVASSDDVLLFVFVHGWKHDASDSDQNVAEFRAILDRTFQRQQSTSDDGKRRKVVGLYVGWRGLSVKPFGLKELTIFDRKNTADHVAKGSVRELFVRLADFTVELNAPRRSGATLADAKSENKMVRTLFMGHSLGALVVFNAMSPHLIDYAVESEAGKDVVPPADLIVLVNPAFEASRYEPLHRLTVDRRFSDKQRPLFISLTAENDWATHYAFRAARGASTVLEGYPPDTGTVKLEKEELANHNTVGWVDRYRTHYLFLDDANHPTKAQFLKRNPAAAATTTPCNTPVTDTSYGNVKLRHAPQENCDPNSPFWIVRVDKEIIDSHDGFFFSGTPPDVKEKPQFIDFILDVFDSAS